jgi:tRNA(fMet)-specific endonuclease VapC
VYILDTDLFSLYFTRRRPIPQLEQRILEADAHDRLYISCVVAHESLRSALAFVRQHEAGERVGEAYGTFVKVLRILGSGLRILPLDDQAVAIHRQFNAELIRTIGRRDSLIAATALSLGFIVVTRNLQDFERVEGLRCENWARAVN